MKDEKNPVYSAVTYKLLFITLTIILNFTNVKHIIKNHKVI